MANSPKFHKLLKTIGELHDRKNKDYAVSDDPFSNFRECERFGIPAWKGVLVRMSDKWSRICNLTSKEAANESLEDSFMDLSVYALICLLLYEETKGDKK